MSDGDRSGRNLFDRSLDLLRDVSNRVQREASRSRHLSDSKTDLTSLRRHRAEAHRKLGVETYRRLKAAGSAELGLSGLEDQEAEIDGLTARIAAREAEITRLEAAAIRQPESAGDKPQKESRRFTTGGTMTGMKIAAPPVSGDPLEDILGKVPDSDMVETD